jgi:RNA polymerase sigma-70 factor (ECF subfamily)
LVIFFGGFMDSTSVNLLRRLREPKSDSAWERFIDLYTPLIFYWAKQRGLAAVDATDLVQDVLLTMVQRIGDFDPEGDGRFRGWLRTITVNRATDFHRSRQRRAEVNDPSAQLTIAAMPDCDFWDETEYRQMLVSRTLELLRPSFHPVTWSVAHAQLVQGQSARFAADAAGITINAAYVAKCRVLAKLREELTGLLD